MFPIHLATMLRMCGASTIPIGAAGSMVKINNLIPAVVGDIDTHSGLGALINVLQHNVNIGGIPAIPSIVSMAAPDILGLIPHVQGLPIPMQGSPNVRIGQGNGSAGIGMMQPITGGLGQILGFQSLGIGEIMMLGQQMIGQIMNFTQIGGGAAVAQMNNLQGSPIGPGTTLTSANTGVTFTFNNYFDSRALTVIPGVNDPGDAANSYPGIDTVTNSLVDYNNEYIVIDDYFIYYPGMNLTASVVTV